MTIETFFHRLDRWRHLPAYRLEPRVDAFFSFYLPEIVKVYKGKELLESIIPELPLRLGTIYTETDGTSNQSVKVDFVLFEKRLETAYFVELKTDGSSRRDVQDEYLKACQGLTMHAILQGLLQVVLNSNAKQKYLHLLMELECIGLIDVPPDLYNFAFPKMRSGFTAAFQRVKINPVTESMKIEVIYVQPNPDPKCDCISFEMFAEAVAKHDDPISQAFAGHLVRWQSVAGGILPVCSDQGR
jgi:hypothetical protein